ncbi:MAG: glutathione S-transferase [Myxococcota bacterium]
MTIVVHHLETSRSHRLLWALEETDVEYRIERYQRNPKTMRAPETLRKVHPLGRAPILELEGETYFESGAILDELADRHPSLRPAADSPAFRRYRFFLHYAEGSVMPPLLVRLIIGQLRGPKIPFLVRPITKGVADKVDAAYTDPEVRNHLDFLESELEGREYLCGDFSAADIQISYPIEAADHRGGLGSRSNLRAYLERLRGRPAYQRAIEKGGPVMMG